MNKVKEAFVKCPLGSGVVNLEMDIGWNPLKSANAVSYGLPLTIPLVLDSDLSQ